MAHILIAEDDVSMSRFLSLALENAGHIVDVVHNGLDALEKIKCEDHHYDLLLSDIVMPGIDGMELSQKATKIRPAMKIMIITGFAASVLGRSEAGGGMSARDVLIAKPFHLNDLIAQIDALLNAH